MPVTPGDDVACRQTEKLGSQLCDVTHCVPLTKPEVRAAQVPGSLPNDPAGFQLQDHFAIATAVSTGDEQPAPIQAPPRL